MLRLIALCVTLSGLLPLSASAQIWSEYAMVSATIGVSGSRICIGESTRGDIGCPSYAPSISATTGHTTFTGGLTVNNVSLTTAGTTWGYLGSTASYLPNFSSNSVSATNISATALTVNGVAITTNGGGAGGSSDRIISTSANVVAGNGGTISFTTGGVSGTAYLDTSGRLVTPGISITTANGISTTRVSVGPSGTAALPVYTWVNDVNTGLFLPALDSIGISTAGTERMRIDSTGSIGMGMTPSTTYRLDVSGGLRSSGEIISTGANAFRSIQGSFGVFWRNDGSNVYLLQTASGDQYGTWNAFRPFVYNLSTGVVGIGTLTNPSYTLNVGGAINATGVSLSTSVNFTATTGDKVTYWGNTYGTGIESFTLTHWADTQHRWRIGGTSVSSGVQSMLLTASGLTVSGTINATRFVGEVATDRISTTGVASGASLGGVAASIGTVSFTTGGIAGTAYFDTVGRLVAPGISITTLNGISSTRAYVANAIGLGTTSPAVSLSVIGEIQVSNSNVVCSAATAGAIRYSAGTLSVCNGTTFSSLSGGGGGSSGDRIVSGTTTAIADPSGNIAVSATVNISGSLAVSNSINLKTNATSACNASNVGNIVNINGKLFHCRI